MEDGHNSTVDITNRFKPALSIWSIGQGFTGSASDWTEYFFWMLGFISLVFWMFQRNPSFIGEVEVVPGDDDDVPPGEADEVTENHARDEGDAEEKKKDQ
mmetsp:Transcript_80994/g.127538  ORF Transcript_80994/g.127538 Transcript_80994/m.127538 type:complete len:100 (-) Transcript_80994:23-322(-)